MGTLTDAFRETFARIDQRDGQLHALVHLTKARALQVALESDKSPQTAPGPLNGTPFVVKNLFDIKGLPTLAGSRINRDLPPAQHDALLVQHLQSAGAILVGTSNMDEYAAGYSTENLHYGRTCNPYDPQRTAGGSSGGSAAAVAAGLVPLALGSDTTGSVRVPAAYCGTWALKPTYGRLSRLGSFPFCHSLDTMGLFADTLDRLLAAYDVLQGPGDAPAPDVLRPVEPAAPHLAEGVQGLRIARLVGHFEAFAQDRVTQRLRQVAHALGTRTEVELPTPDRAAAAALLITRAESAQLHLHNLRLRPADFDPAIRNRMMANAIAPASWYIHAQRERRRHHQSLMQLFGQVDVLLAPATPTPAFRFSDDMVTLAGASFACRNAAGLFTAPFSLVGVPVLSAPLDFGDPLPLGLQVIAAPWREDLCLRVGAELARMGVARCRPLD